MNKGYIPTDRRLVHKRKNENVLLANLRRILPAAIDADAFAAASEKLPPADQELLASAYVEVDSAEPWNLGHAFLSREVYGTMSLSTDAYESARSGLSGEQRSHLEQSYRAENRGTHRLTQPLHDDLLRQVIKFANLREFYLENERQHQVSEILESTSIADQRDIYFANLIVDTSHEFFFEHPNEHVPGMMILEAARQMLMAISHRYGNVSIGTTHLVLDRLEVQFSGFVELYSPAIIRAELTRKTMHHGIWASMTAEMTIHQNGFRLGTVHAAGSGVSHGVFGRIRRMKYEELKSLPFVPSDNLSHTLFLKSEAGGAWREGRIVRMNLTRFDVVLKDNSEVSGEKVDFVMVFSDLGSAAGTCRIESVERDLYTFKVESLTQAEEEKLSLVLKRHCKVPERATL